MTCVCPLGGNRWGSLTLSSTPEPSLGSTTSRLELTQGAILLVGFVGISGIRIRGVTYFSSGFLAGAGWDPVTGLGTPDFAKLRNLVWFTFDIGWQSNIPIRTMCLKVGAYSEFTHQTDPQQWVNYHFEFGNDAVFRRFTKPISKGYKVKLGTHEVLTLHSVLRPDHLIKDHQSFLSILGNIPI
jgi:hypothetical protein